MCVCALLGCMGSGSSAQQLNLPLPHSTTHRCVNSLTHKDTTRSCTHRHKNTTRPIAHKNNSPLYTLGHKNTTHVRTKTQVTHAHTQTQLTHMHTQTQRHNPSKDTSTYTHLYVHILVYVCTHMHTLSFSSFFVLHLHLCTFETFVHWQWVHGQA